jgi:hypothetical protein
MWRRGLRHASDQPQGEQRIFLATKSQRKQKKSPLKKSACRGINPPTFSNAGYIRLKSPAIAGRRTSKVFQRTQEKKYPPYYFFMILCHLWLIFPPFTCAAIHLLHRRFSFCAFCGQTFRGVEITFSYSLPVDYPLFSSPRVFQKRNAEKPVATAAGTAKPVSSIALPV